MAERSPTPVDPPDREPRCVVLGVCGGIAAYKAVEVCRRLGDEGLRVVCVLTEEARRFVGALTFAALSDEPVRTSLWDDPSPIPHTELGRRADAVVVAPATAHLIARYAAGMADDLLTSVLLATRAPVVLCPAMHTEMWEHPAVRDNVAALRRRGVTMVPPGTGRLAGGDVGQGRLAEPEEILAALRGVLGRRRVPAPAGESAPRGDLAGLSVLVSAGGTREPIDPVRFIGNRSSGKQGHAVAEAAARRGAAVRLVTASSLPVAPDVAGVIRLTRVETAAEMEAAMLAEASTADVIVMAAAVADFRPKTAAARKLSKDNGVPQLVLEPTPDVLSTLAGRRREGQVVVGFAAETGVDLERARAKLARKGVDLLVVNDVTAPEAGFEQDTNAVVMLDAGGGALDVPLTTKSAVAEVLLDTVVRQLRPAAGKPRRVVAGDRGGQRPREKPAS